MSEAEQIAGVIIQDADGDEVAEAMEDLSDGQLAQTAGGYGSDIDPVAYAVGPTGPGRGW